jgi:membrane protease YdiL (CAAX protease family)
MKADSGTPKPFTIPRALGMLMPTFVLLPLLGWLVGVDYDAIADSTPNILRGIVPAVGLSLAWGIFIAWRAGWLRSIFAKQPASSLPKLFWLIPACWFGMCLVRLAGSPWPSFDATYIVVLAFAMILVGFNEEILFRGILAHGARGPGPWSEARAMLVSSLGFGLFHLPNALGGQALGATLFQVGYAFVMGIALFVSMRISRRILLPVALHALWDFSTFTSKSQTPGDVAALVTAALTLAIVILILAAIAWALGKKRQPVSNLPLP